MNRETDGWVRVFEVIEPQRHRKGFTVYKVVSRVFPKTSVEGITEIVTFKRFSEFKKLHKSLSHLHFSLHLKGVFPPFPDPKLFGRFDADVIETRRRSALELLEFAAKHPPLFTSNVFVQFFDKSVTNFKTVCRHHVIDSPTQEDNHLLPQPLEPNLNLSDDFSHRSGDNTSDNSSYYSTPNHSMDSSLNQHNLVNSKTKLSEFDPLVQKDNKTTEDSPQEQSEDNSKNWFIYAIQSCDNEIKDSEESKTTFSGNGENVEIPGPFAESMISSQEINTEKDISNDLFAKQFSISCDSDNNTIENISNGIEDENPISKHTPNEPLEADTYLLDAAIILKQAQQHEDNNEWEPAFESLKCAVGILLQGVVNETDSEKKASIRRKTFQYLTRAEHIYDTYLSQTNAFQPSRRWAPESPFKSLNVSLVQSWFGSSQELSKFKVIGLISNKLQTVVDTTTDNVFVIKVIYKTNICESIKPTIRLTTNRLSLAQSVFPNDIPFMVQIYRIFKTEYAIFLLLEYAKGGKLWDRVLSKSSTCLSPCPDCMFTFDEKDCQLIADNPYSGRRISRTRSECDSNDFIANTNSVFETISEQQVLHKSSSVESCSPSGSLVSIESIDYDIPSKSYSKLCNNYAFVQQKWGRNTSLCHLGHISDSIDSIDSITECDSKPYSSYELSNRDRTLSQSQRQPSTESLGISGLLAKARGILKNVDQTLNLTKYMTKTANSITKRSNDLRESKSELTLSQFNSKPISEVFHQTDDNSNGSIDRAPVSEEEARVWLSQIVKCLQQLHKLGIIYFDLKPQNLLLTENNILCVSYKCFSNESPLDVIDDWAKEHLYVAPEVFKSDKITDLCDWWTLGVLAFELLSGRPLVSYYPNGITSHTELYFPHFMSISAKDLINKLLVPNPSERLGRHGSEEIITHPFFEGINWTND